MKPVDFFARYPVFRYDEFIAVHSANGRRSRQTSIAVLKQHIARGNLIRIHRGLYMTIPRGLKAQKALIDPYLITSKLHMNSVIAYHGALQFHGKAYSIWRRFHYLTPNRSRSFIFRDMEFIPVAVPVNLRTLSDEEGEIIAQPHMGGLVRVTSLERTFVDVLNAPDKGGGWEEVWQSLEMIQFFNLDAVVNYVKKLGSALTAARVGFFLEQHREQLMVEKHYLNTLKKLAPAQPRYFDRKKESGQLLSRWNLIVPTYILNRTWAEQGI